MDSGLAKDHILDIQLLDPDAGDALTLLPWVADGITFNEQRTLETLLELTETNQQIARLTIAFPWMTDGIAESERQVVSALATFVGADPELAQLIASLPWVADDITGIERGAISGLALLAKEEAAVTKLIASLPWAADEITQAEQTEIRRLTGLARRNPGMIGRMATLPWVTDGINESERKLIRWLEWLNGADPVMAEWVMGLPWVADSINQSEWYVLYHLAGLANTDKAIAQHVTGFPWFLDARATFAEGAVVGALWGLADVDRALAKRVADFHWLADDITDAEDTALDALGGFADTELALARRLAALPWFEDGITEAEGAALTVLDVQDPETVRGWLDRMADDEAMLFLTVLGWAREVDARLVFYNDLLQAHFVQNAKISLPLSGEINLWVFQSKPFRPDEDLIAWLGGAARNYEEFLGLPLPVTDVILLIPTVGPQEDHRFLFGGGHHGPFMHLVRFEPNPIGRDTVYHETAHYYFRFGPAWFAEGGAEFMVMYANDRAGLKSLEEERSELWSRVEEDCVNKGVETILQLREQHSGIFEGVPDLFTCSYSLGAYFLLELYNALGEEALLTAMQTYFLEFQYLGTSTIVVEEGGIPVPGVHEEALRVEEVFFDALLKNASPEQEEAFVEIYRRLYGDGGPYAD